jgi:2-keto-4-pentenoate hydratase/2-oxohepta-3-ene-1,7-dioic acid hydratase in catechol pathway
MRLARGEIGGALRVGLLEDDRFHELAGGVFDAPDRTGASWPVDDVILRSPIDPGRILCVMGGFLPAGADAMPADATPWFIPKGVSSVGGDRHTIVPPAGVEHFWIEPELAIVIGADVRHASEEQALAAIFGVTCLNDVTAPEFMFDDLAARRRAALLDSFRAKGQDTFAAMGPCIRTDLTQADVSAGLAIVGRINGEIAGEGTTRRQKFPLGRWVSFASQVTTLRRGDVIALGTPAPCDARPGDEVEIEVEGIGALRAHIARHGESL